MPRSLILASASTIRAALLHRAGLDFRVEQAKVDEEEIKASLRAEGGDPQDCAVILAEMKATRVATRNPGHLVIGADQMLVEGETWFDKPPSQAAAFEQVKRLSGKTHRLISAAVVAYNGSRIWHGIAEARMTMRELSDREIEDYLARAGIGVLSSVGAYQLEGLGVNLFSRIEGDYFTILGLPLLPLLAFLRGHERPADKEQA